jgi:uncharacterized protein Smg (DUF494 family)
MLEQLVPFDDLMTEIEFASEEGSSFIAFLRNGQEDPTFLEVFERLWNRLLNPEASPEKLAATKPFRVFTEEEEHLIDTEARGYLLRLQASGLLGTTQFETVIDRAFECWAEEISLDQVRFLVAAVLLHELLNSEGFEQSSNVPPSIGLD